ncbi:hypothetical protein PGTUg99_029053 [Puccinia graminis f. sp. tritici]|uniref:Uncharacterized protein n=1 Tax=Puccinia graminis f. sp. tritici TaxID=56615 RepID=A0A5B0SM21_PUCGR|nr:hypothetical protein PGTUg99_029053 [Puccinia graminis f. sp. tritici]
MLGLSQLLITFYLLNHHVISAHPLSSGETLSKRGFGGATSLSFGNHALRKRMEGAIAGGVQASEKGLGSGAHVEELKAANSGLSARPVASVPIIEFPHEDTPALTAHEQLPPVNPSVSGTPASGELEVVQLDPESLDKSAAVTPAQHKASSQAGPNPPTPVPSTSINPAPETKDPKEITNTNAQGSTVESSPAKVNEPTAERTGETQPTAVATTPESQSGHEASVASSQTKDAKDGVNAQVEDTPNSSGRGATVPVDSDAKNTHNAAENPVHEDASVKSSENKEKTEINSTPGKTQQDAAESPVGGSSVDMSQDKGSAQTPVGSQETGEKASGAQIDRPESDEAKAQHETAEREKAGPSSGTSQDTGSTQSPGGPKEGEQASGTQTEAEHNKDNTQREANERETAGTGTGASQNKGSTQVPDRSQEGGEQATREQTNQPKNNEERAQQEAAGGQNVGPGVGRSPDTATPHGDGQQTDRSTTSNPKKGDQDTNDNLKGSGSDSNSQHPEGSGNEYHQSGQLVSIQNNEEVAQRNSERDTNREKIEKIKQARRKAREQQNSNRNSEEEESNRQGQESSAPIKSNEEVPQRNSERDTNREEIERIKQARRKAREQQNSNRNLEEEESNRQGQDSPPNQNKPKTKEEEEKLKIQQQKEENLKRQHEEEERLKKQRLEEEEAERQRQVSQSESERRKQLELENKRKEENERKRKEEEERKETEQVEAEKKRLEALKNEQERARQQQEAERNKQSNVHQNSEIPNDESVHNESQKSGAEPHSEHHKEGDNGETPSNPSTPKGNEDDPALEEKLREANKKFANDQPKKGFFHPIVSMFKSMVRRIKISWNKLWNFLVKRRKSSVHPPEGEVGALLAKDVPFNPSDEPPNTKVAREAAQKGELAPLPAPPAEKQKEPFHTIPDHTAESK